jgi:hypothetical protein
MERYLREEEDAGYCHPTGAALRWSLTVMLFCSLLATLLVSAAPVSAYRGHPRGFAYADGENFAIDGNKFYYFGTNAYWFPFLSVCTDAV